MDIEVLQGVGRMVLFFHSNNDDGDYNFAKDRKMDCPCIATGIKNQYKHNKLRENTIIY